MRGTFFLYNVKMAHIFPAAFKQRHFKRGNKMKYVLALIAGLSLSLSFVACDKDDKDESSQVEEVTDTADTSSQDVSDTATETVSGDTGSDEDTGTDEDAASDEDTGSDEEVTESAEDTGADAGE